jgi:ATP-dependent helicase/DNAse subunit B
VTAQVVVLSGPARSGKTHELVGLYRAALESNEGRLDRTIWLAPTGRAAAAVRELLVERGLQACLRPGALTFDDLAGQVIDAAGLRPNRLGNVAKRELLRRVVGDALDRGALSYFADGARRSGFVELVAEHIAELKRRDIGPNAPAAAKWQREPQWRELAQLYLDYESQLLKHDLIDYEGRLQAARDALAKNKCPRFHELELLVVDGFTDFTRTERDVLRLLSKYAARTFISLPTDANGAAKKSTFREDLFAKTSATLGQLRHEFPQLEVRELTARVLPCPAIDFIAANLFRHPSHVAAAPAEVRDGMTRLEIVEAASAQDEINQIARRTKKLLTAGTRPGEVVVVFRSLADAAPRIREVFKRFGIPFVLDAGRPIISAPLVRTLIALLRLDREDWPFRRLVSVVTNNTLSALDANGRRAADWLIRDLQFASGRSALLNRVESLAADAISPRDRSEHLARRVEATTAALPCLMQFAGALDKLPETATPMEWCQALAALATDLRIPPFANGGEALSPTGHLGEELNAADVSAWNSLLNHFNALERLDAWLDEPMQKRSRAELLSLLLDVAANESISRYEDAAGRVRIIAAPTARHIAARHLFIAGMSEQAFPSPERAGNLATEAAYRNAELAARGDEAADLPMPSRAQAEMLLFYEVISRAQDSLTISYPALDDKAQTLPPSPYVVEIERIIGKEGFMRIRKPPQLSPVLRADEETCSGLDWRVQAVARAIEPEGNRRLLAGVFSYPELQHVAGAIDAGLRIVHARARGESFGPAEGLLTSPAIAERLAQRFGPRHAWSASQWETYAACPFRFFMQQVLGLELLGDLVLETDFARRGSRLHDVLATFHREWMYKRGEQPLSADQEAAAFLAHLREVVDARTGSMARAGVDAALLELDRRQILKWANRHYDDHDAYREGCTKLGAAAMEPKHFEFRFGSPRGGDADADPDSTSDAFVIEIDGERIQVTGQIDRIDVGKVGEKTVFNVIDYKSGRKTSLKREQLETGQQLQLPIYVEAAQVLLFQNQATPLQAGYWGMASGFDSRGALAAKQDEAAKDRWKETQSVVHRLIAEFVRAIRHGDFPVASRDEKCTGTCDFHMTCRVSQVRNLGKTWWPELDPKTK